MANQPNPAVSVGRRSAGRGRERAAWLLLGLLIGLLIGWVVWPVEWTDAGLDDLSPAARAQFVSATADAYVASGGQDPATALARMYGFANPQTAVAEAIAFYQQSSDPNRAIRDINLRSLASALGALPITGRAPTPEQEIGWLDWILVAFAALLLLAGGIWIGRKLWMGRGLPARPTPAQPTSVNPPASSSQPAWVLPRSLTPSPSSPPPSTQSARSATDWQPAAPADQPLGQRGRAPRVVVETWDDEADAPTSAGEEILRIVPGRSQSTIFDPDEEDETFADADEPDEVGFDLSDAEENDAEEVEGEDQWQSWEFPKVPTLTASPAAPLGEDDGGWENDWRGGGSALDDDESDDELDELDDESDAEEDDTGVTPAAPAPLIPTAPETKTRVPPSSLPKAPVEDGDESGGGFLPTVQGVLSSFRRGDKERSPAAPISTFVAEFHAGILAYEQSFTINPTGGESEIALGACGVGISEELDKEAAHSDKVRVLQVWLYDGSDVRTWNQYLISPGMDKEALAAQAKSSATITGDPLEISPGLTFRILSKNLMLDCRVVAAEFLSADTPPNPLRNVRIEMTAKAVK